MTRWRNVDSSVVDVKQILKVQNRNSNNVRTYNVSNKADINPKLLDYINAGETLFITGPGGVGKSYIVNEILSHSHPELQIALTASTGIAAMNIGGCTVHSLMGMGIRNKPEDLSRVTAGYNWKWTKERLSNIDLLIIDEISMLSSGQLDLIDAILNCANALKTEKYTPFGGIQVLLVGDFLQLPPVSKSSSPQHMAFRSKVWQKHPPRGINLTKIYRQNDLKFIKLLQEVRKGFISKEGLQLLKTRFDAKFESNVEPALLVGTNREVDAIHRSVLDKFEGTSFINKSSIIVQEDFKKYGDTVKKQIVNNCIAEETLEVKPGMQVMILCNNMEEGYVNGSLGTFVSGTDDTVVVQLHRTEETIELPVATWELRDSVDKVKGTLEQFPIKLAYAYTVHKTQGMTLDYVKIDMKRIWEDGQMYVALSRLRSLDGLILSNFHLRKIKANKEALQFYGGVN